MPNPVSKCRLASGYHSGALFDADGVLWRYLAAEGR